MIYRRWDVLGAFFREGERETRKQREVIADDERNINNCLVIYSNENNDAVVLRLSVAFQFWVHTEMPVLQFLQLAACLQLEQNLGKDGRVW